jgi:hypothetical protein
MSDPVVGSALVVRSPFFGDHAADRAARSTPVFSLFFLAPPVDIDAPPELVWEVITDFAAYPGWNPFNRAIEPGDQGQVGDSVRLEVSWGPYTQDGAPVDPSSLKTDLENTERITIREEGRCFAYGDDWKFLHRAERFQLLEPLAEGRTRFHTAESMVGLLTPLVRLLGGRIRAGFEASGPAVKVRAEALHRARQEPSLP